MKGREGGRERKNRGWVGREGAEAGTRSPAHTVIITEMIYRDYLLMWRLSLPSLPPTFFSSSPFPHPLCLFPIPFNLFYPFPLLFPFFPLHLLFPSFPPLFSLSFSLFASHPCALGLSLLSFSFLPLPPLTFFAPSHLLSPHSPLSRFFQLLPQQPFLDTLLLNSMISHQKYILKNTLLLLA